MTTGNYDNYETSPVLNISLSFGGHTTVLCFSILSFEVRFMSTGMIFSRNQQKHGMYSIDGGTLIHSDSRCVIYALPLILR